MVIEVKRFQIPVHIGITDKEREKAQNIYCSFKVDVTISNSIQTDKIEGTVDYRQLSTIIQKVAKSRHWKLMENLAYHIIQKIMKIDSKINDVSIIIEKRNTYSYQSADYIAIAMSNKDKCS